MFPNDWKIYSVGELTENFDALRVPVRELDRQYGPYPYYGASGIVDHVSEYLFEGEHLLVAEDGENLRSRQTPIAFIASGKFWVNNHAHIVRGNSLALTRFLAYALQAKDISAYLTGSTLPKLTQANLNLIPILTPPLAEQEGIVHVLRALDDKIDVNRRMNETLQAFVRAIFKSWFVDFDPVSAKADPPADWTDGKFADVAENIRDQARPSEVPPTTPYIGLEHMPRKSISLGEWGITGDVASNKFAFRTGDILFGKLRPYFHKVGVAAVNGVCSTDILVIRAKEPMWFSFVLGHASSAEMVDYADAGSTGTKMPRTSWDELSRFEIAIPSRQLAEKFNNTALPLVEKIRANIHESRTLASLREALVPRLMSGEIRLEDAEKIVETNA
jgi:type I restriction enzyme, S subunit